jgi:hypothetical protein
VPGDFPAQFGQAADDFRFSDFLAHDRCQPLPAFPRS